MLKHRSGRIAEINAVPYVDVMLVLLIIFMVAAPLLTQGFEVRLPQAEAPPVELSDPVVVTMLADKTLRINAGQSPEQPASLDTIAKRLAIIVARNPELAVLVEGDAQVPYGDIVRLLSVLNTAGIQNVGLATALPVQSDVAGSP